MAEQVLATHTDSPAADEKALPVMIYSRDSLHWGQMLLRQNLRLNIILGSSVVPDFLSICQANTLLVDADGPHKPTAYSEIHIPTEQVIALHLMPPHEEPPDYDPEAPNRKMEPVTALVGAFRFEGCVRMSSRTDLKTFLGVAKSAFLSIYDVEISLPNQTAMQPIRVPCAQVRRKAVSFAGGA